MSCLNANITLARSLGVCITNETKHIATNVTYKNTIVAHCLLVCSVHNSLNVLLDNCKILFDGDKLLFD